MLIKLNQIPWLPLALWFLEVSNTIGTYADIMNLAMSYLCREEN